MPEKQLVCVRNLEIAFKRRGQKIPVVRGIDFDLWAGRTLALVGESGCGKTVSALALLNLVDPRAQVTASTLRFLDTEILKANPERLRSLRGREIAMVFQEPGTALNPVISVGKQIAESLALKQSAGKFRQATLDMLALVGLTDPKKCYSAYPHELSGGMRQLALIAMALASRPQVLIADEILSSLDVTHQNHVLQLLKTNQAETGMAILFISHNLAQIGRLANEVAIMYAGRIIEMGNISTISNNPRHPYTRGLWRSAPTYRQKGVRLPVISEPSPKTFSASGCAFASRCPNCQNQCTLEIPALNDGLACFFSDPKA